MSDKIMEVPFSNVADSIMQRFYRINAVTHKTKTARHLAKTELITKAMMHGYLVGKGKKEVYDSIDDIG